MASPIARSLRKQPTEAEKLLWQRLRYKQLGEYRFRRQVPMGSYVVDFFCPEAKLIVELDGGQHAEQAARDRERTQWLELHGYRVIRFWNNEVFENLDGLLETIAAELDSRH